MTVALHGAALLLNFQALVLHGGVFGHEALNLNSDLFFVGVGGELVHVDLFSVVVLHLIQDDGQLAARDKHDYLVFAGHPAVFRCVEGRDTFFGIGVNSSFDVGGSQPFREGKRWRAFDLCRLAGILFRSVFEDLASEHDSASFEVALGVGIEEFDLTAAFDESLYPRVRD